MHDLLPELKKKKLLLASGSPRRRELLEAAGFRPKFIPLKKVDETLPENLEGCSPAEYLANRKASAYISEISSDELLLAADTIVCLEEEILGKPKNNEEAFEMLKKLSGRRHCVTTGVAMCSKHWSVHFSDSTFVDFKPLNNSELNYYINHYKPFDKAGAYGIQEWIGLVGVEKLEGSYFNVMGLPVAKIFDQLKKNAGRFFKK